MKPLLYFTPMLMLLMLAADAAPKSIDVTQKVIAAIRNSALSVVVNSENLGAVDADPPKLRITYAVMNRVRTRAWQEGQTAEISAPPGQALNVSKAEYGQMDDAVDVTPAVRALVKDNAIPSVTVDDQSMGVDPTHGISKEVVVRYAAGGKQKMIGVEESEELKIPAPAGGGKLTIVEATYGLPTTVFDVTDMVADMLQGNSLNVTPSDELFGDPAPRISGKKLQVEYVQAGEKHTVSAEAGKPLEIKPVGSTPLIILKAGYGVF